MDKDDALDGGIAAYLEAIRRDECYRVDRILKDGPPERTELVYFVGSNGAELGPFVRKAIASDSGLGGVYRDLLSARRRGLRLRYVPAVYDVHEAGDELVVVLEHVPGRTLRAIVDGTPPHERFDLARKVVPAVCRAAHELHTSLERPVVHRDVTPSNVICLPEDPSVLSLVDLGIARQYRAGADHDTTHFGTRLYAPPEQYGFGQTDVRADVYSIGLVAFFCLTGREATAKDRERGFVDPGVPERLRKVVARAAELDPDRRYEDALQLGEAFSAAFSEISEGVPASPPAPSAAGADRRIGPAEPVKAPSRRLGKVWNVLVLAVLAFMCVASVAAFVDPSDAVLTRPVWVRAVDYLVLMPMLFGLVAWAVADKRAILPKMGRFGTWTKVQRACLWVALVLACLFALALSGAATA